MENKKRSLLIAVGGSGGHIFPAQQLATCLGKQDKLFFAGFDLSKNSYFNQTFAYVDIPAAPLSFSFKGAFFLIKKTLQGFRKSLQLLREENPALIIGFGSYHVFPLLLAAKWKKVPIILFEANRVCGMINKLFLSKNTILAAQFPLVNVKSQNVKRVAFLPWVKKEKLSQKQARQALGFAPEIPLLFVFGGSQGAVFINEAVYKAAIALKEKGINFQIAHITGKNTDAKELFKKYQKKGIKAVCIPFTKEISTYYSAADLAICRAGASSICELLHYACPSILIPYPHSRDRHQYYNAKFLEENGGASLIEQKGKSEQNLKQMLFLYFAKDRNKIKEQKKALLTLAKKEKYPLLDQWIRTNILGA